MDVVNRLLGSQKLWIVAVTAVGNVVAASFGVDVTEPAMMVADTAFGLLLLIQGVLDYKWGSVSDGTGPKKK